MKMTAMIFADDGTHATIDDSRGVLVMDEGGKAIAAIAVVDGRLDVGISPGEIVRISQHIPNATVRLPAQSSA